MTDVVWKVDPGLGFAVTVVDAAEQPVPWAEVRLDFPSGGSGRVSRSFTVDGKGRYEFPTTLEPGTYRLSAAGPYDATPVTLDLRAGADRPDVTLRLEGAAAIVVNVRSNEGDPVDGLDVVARRSATAVATGLRAPPGAAGVTEPAALVDRLQRANGAFRGSALGKGQYRIGPLGSGDYEVRVSDPDGGEAQASVTVVDAVAGVDVVFDRGGSIRGRVVDGAGQPVPDATVYAQADVAGARASAGAGGGGASAIAAGDGTFEIRNLSRGTRYGVRAEEPGMSDAVQGGVAVGSDVTLTLLSFGSLSGTAVDDRGQPVARFTLGTQKAGGAGRAIAVTTAGGGWSADRVAAGHVRILATDDESRVATQEVDIPPGQRVDGVRLVFSKTMVAP